MKSEPVWIEKIVELMDEIQKEKSCSGEGLKEGIKEAKVI